MAGMSCILWGTLPKTLSTPPARRWAMIDSAASSLCFVDGLALLQTHDRVLGSAACGDWDVRGHTASVRGPVHRSRVGRMNGSKPFRTCSRSSVGRALDCGSKGRWFNPTRLYQPSRHSRQLSSSTGRLQPSMPFRAWPQMPGSDCLLAYEGARLCGHNTCPPWRPTSTHAPHLNSRPQ